MDKRFVRRTPRALLCVGLLLLVALQAVLPWVSGQAAQDSRPIVADLRRPVLTASMLGICCVEVMLVCVWKLLGAVRRSRIVGPRALRSVDVIVWALAVCTVLTLGTLIYTLRVIFPPLTADTFDLLAVLLGAGVLLLMAVMRRLLRQAIGLQTEMDAVI